MCVIGEKASVKLPSMREISMLSVVACVALGLLSGCGDEAQEPRSRSDAQVAEQIRVSATKREIERNLRARDVAARQRAHTMTMQAGPAQPAGTAEIEGATAAATSAGSGGLLSAADRASFARLAAKLTGHEGVAVSTVGINRPVSRVGELSSGVAWSTAKSPVAMAAISAGVGARSDLVQAITASDNAAAERLWSSLGKGASAAATAQLRAVGDQRTVVEARRLRAGYTAFGQTNWVLTDQARFAAGMACTDPGAQVLALMNQVVAGQRWGLGSTGNRAKFKGGWGPGISPGNGNGWLDRQMGVLTIKGKPIGVAIATTASGHDAGTQNLTTIARWVATHVDVNRAPRSPRC